MVKSFSGDDEYASVGSSFKDNDFVSKLNILCFISKFGKSQYNFTVLYDVKSTPTPQKKTKELKVFNDKIYILKKKDNSGREYKKKTITFRSTEHVFH